MTSESACAFDCMDDVLLSVVHHGCPSSTSGIIIVVGGPQYRVGSHRQFVIMARSLAEAGIPVMRFDCRGMGDSDGNFESFKHLKHDIQAAIRMFRSLIPTLENIVLLGLCDGASAISLCCNNDESVKGLVLMNPWVRSTASEAKAYVKHYYSQRIWQRSFWRKITSGQFEYGRSLRDLWWTLAAYLSSKGERSDGGTGGEPQFVVEMLSNLQKFSGDILVILSANDLTAREFNDLCATDPDWKALCERQGFIQKSFPAADHTLSNRQDLNAATQAVRDWLEEGGRRGGMRAPGDVAQ